MMIASWSDPSEGNIYGVVEVDVTKAQLYIEKLRKEHGEHITITHISLKALALGVREAPCLNGRLICGRFFPFTTIDMGCLVALDGGKDLANAKLTEIDKRSIVDICRQLRQKTEKLRQGKDEDFNKTTSTLQMLPIEAIQFIVSTVGYLASALGLNFPALGARPFPFGCALVTSVGMMGLDLAFVPFLPFARVPFLAMIGSVVRKPRVMENDRIEVRPIVTMTATMDHRFVDGAQAARMAARVKEVMEDPEKFDFDEMEETKKTD
jgi:pyruvate dehydrogenase E2 component (dihydrolipoamide acetyltransferase)